MYSFFRLNSYTILIGITSHISRKTLILCICPGVTKFGDFLEPRMERREGGRRRCVNKHGSPSGP